ncbi:MAG: phage antirepressor N-terminal domain-containing protein, partial [Chloroflexia bacterium]
MNEQDSLDNPEPGKSQTALVPLREQVVDFYGDKIPVAQIEEGDLYVPLRPLTDFLGLAFSSQRQRILRDDVLSEQMRMIVMARSDGRRVEMLCLPLDLLPGWLFGVQPGRARPELVSKLKRYRTECFRVLWQAFKGDILPAAIPGGELSGAALALEIATAVQHLARQQLAMETRLGEVAGKQEIMAGYLRGFIHNTDQRLTSLELQLGGGATVTEAQAAEIALAVKNVGQRLATKGDRNGYAKVYSELYRRYGVSSYRNLSQSKYK